MHVTAESTCRNSITYMKEHEYIQTKEIILIFIEFQLKIMDISYL